MPRPLSDDEAWIVAHNLPLVEACLRGYKCDDATREDLRAAGYVGLCHAIQKYNPRTACLSTYARYWIRRYIQKELQAMPFISVPAYHRWDVKGKWTEICKKRHGLAAERIMAAHRVSWHDSEAVAAIAVAPPVEPNEAGLRYLRELTRREQMVIRRIVMNGEEAADVARDIGVSRRRVGVIKNQAIRQLRSRMLGDRPERGMP